MGVQTHPPRCPRGCGTHPPSLSSRMRGPIPLVVLADAGTHPHPVSSRMWEPIPLGVLADAGTHPLDVDSDATGVRYSRVEPAPVKTDAGTHPHALSSRMRESIPTRCPRVCVNPSPPVVPADAGTLPHPLSSRMRGPIPTRYPRVEPAPVKTDAGIHPPTRQSRAPLTPLPLLSSWQAHDGDGASSADRSPCPPGCWTTDRRRTPGPPRAARPPSARARRRGCSGRP